MSKLVAKAKSSKLSESLKHEAESSVYKEKVLRTSRPKSFPRSYKIDPEVMNILNATLDKLNLIAPRKVTESRLIRALIILSSEIEEEKLIKALKESW